MCSSLILEVKVLACKITFVIIDVGARLVEIFLKNQKLAPFFNSLTSSLCNLT